MRTILSHQELLTVTDTVSHISNQVSSFLAITPFGPREEGLVELAQQIEIALQHADSLATEEEELDFLDQRANELNGTYAYETHGVEMYINRDLEVVFLVHPQQILSLSEALRKESRVLVGGFIALAMTVRTFMTSVSDSMTRVKAVLG